MTANEVSPADLTALQQTLNSDCTEETLLDTLESELIRQKQFHRLFDALLIRSRRKMGLSVVRPTSLNNVPAESESGFRETYVAAARRVGHLFLEHGMLADAWAYLRTIGEHQPVRDAIEKLKAPREPDAEFDEVMNVALYEGAHPVKGLEFLLQTHGTCNTVTAFSQLQSQMSVEDRRGGARVMVRQIYTELLGGLRRVIEQRMPLLDSSAGVSELIRTRDWLFAEGAYHIDVSHLHSTVGFARALEASDPELLQAVELCDYGSRLAEHLRYPADVPFDDYYTANRWFLSALAGESQDEAIDYFRKRIDDEPDEPDRRLIAFVLIDLAQRIDRGRDVLDVVAPYLDSLEDPNGFSFSELCAELHAPKYLREAAERNADPLALVTAWFLERSAGDSEPQKTPGDVSVTT